MPLHINPNDPDCKTAAAEILRRHNEGQPEANITTAVRDFLTTTGLVKPEHIVEENPPAQSSRRAVDLTALDTFIEFKRRIGTTGGFNPDPRTSTNWTTTSPSPKRTAASASASSPTANTGSSHLRATVRVVVTEPFEQSVLASESGSWTFVAEAVTQFNDAAANANEPAPSNCRMRSYS